MEAQEQEITRLTKPAPKKADTFGSDVLKIAGGTIFAQLLMLLATPFLARMYKPDAFGLMAIFTSITVTISTVACLRYELSIMLPKEDRDAANLLGVCLVALVTVSFLTIPAAWLLRSRVLLWLNAPELGPYLILVPLSVLVSAMFVALNYWNSRTRHYGRLSIARIVSSIASTGLQIGAGLSGFITGGSLIYASILGSAVSVLVLGGQIWRDDGGLIKGSLCHREMAAGAARYRKFPLLDSWSALLNVISWQLPTFLLSMFFSSTVVGYYALGMNVLQLPMSLIGSAIAQVFFQQAAEAKFEGRLSEVVEGTFIRLGMVGIFPILLLAFLGRDIFTVAYGSAWSEAGVYVQILALWIFFVFITSPICALFSVLERQGAFLVFNAALFVARAAALAIGGISGDARVALALFSAVGVIAWAGLCIWLLNETGVSLSRAARSFVRYLAYCTPIFCLAVLARGTLQLDPLQMVVAGALTAVPYYILAIRQDEGLQLPFNRILHRTGALK
ncbi:MAG TPA: oligosaccharide flippase family protein [Methanotrichaceae archaeon]|nr:oligosaccharide flippase family protein [Methanotrichaceae archaeon]